MGDPSTVALKRCPSSDPKPTPAYSSAPYSVQSHTGLPYSSISPNTTRIHPTICNHITNHTHLTISTPLHFTLCHSTQISQVSRVNQYSESFTAFPPYLCISIILSFESISERGFKTFFPDFRLTLLSLLGTSTDTSFFVFIFFVALDRLLPLT